MSDKFHSPLDSRDPRSHNKNMCCYLKLFLSDIGMKNFGFQSIVKNTLNCSVMNVNVYIFTANGKVNEEDSLHLLERNQHKSNKNTSSAALCIKLIACI